MKKKENYLYEEKLNVAKDYVFATQKGKQGIGSLSEKTVHSVLKNMYEPNLDYQEVAINGYFADICKGNDIIEIQTQSFNRMRDKLDSFLQEYSVRIVYPIPYTKWLIWIHDDTREYTKKRKCPKKGTPYKVFYELYKIKSYLNNPNLKLDILLIDIEEYRMLNGWSKDKKRGSERYDRIPIGIVEHIIIEETRDYIQLLPYELEEEFSAKDYAKITGLSSSQASTAMNILNYLNVVKKVGKQGNAYIYSVNE